MGFAASKLFGALTIPGNLFLLLLVAGLSAISLGRWPTRPGGWLDRHGARLERIGWRGAWAAALILVVVAVLPVGALLERSLETRFPPLAVLPDRVDGIIVLGGAADPEAAAETHRPELTAAAERLLVIPELARRYPQAPILFTGGSARVFPPYLSEAPVARATLAAMGMDPDRVQFEGESRNTWENALFSRDILHPRPDQVWLLVTSAAHMPRSVGVFRHTGWRVIPYPVDLRVPRLTMQAVDFDLPRGLILLSQATHEYMGLLGYWLTGRIDQVLPGPDTRTAPPEHDSKT